MKPRAAHNRGSTVGILSGPIDAVQGGETVGSWTAAVRSPAGPAISEPVNDPKAALPTAGAGDASGVARPASRPRPRRASPPPLKGPALGRLEREEALTGLALTVALRQLDELKGA